MKPLRRIAPVLAIASLAGMAASLPAPAFAQYRQKVSHDASKCSGSGPAVRVVLNGVKASTGTIRVQTYRGTAADWLAKGKWINRVEVPAKAGRMTVCMPLPAAGVYGIAVRHDLNRNGKTDLREDGGGMSNNPSINIWNLGKPSYKATAVRLGGGVSTTSINMQYM